MTRRFRNWASSELPLIPRTWDECLDPDEQLDGLLFRYSTGRRLAFPREFHVLKPVGSSVWEMKTPDVRIFGWFCSADLFVACSGYDASKVKELRLYGPFRDEVAHVRQQLQLPCIEGEDPNVVVSDCD